MLRHDIDLTLFFNEYINHGIKWAYNELLLNQEVVSSSCYMNEILKKHLLLDQLIGKRVM